MSETKARTATQSHAPEKAEDKRRRPDSTPSSVNALAGDIFLTDTLLGTSVGDPRLERHAAILSDPRFSHSASWVQKAQIVSGLQSRYGNAYVQRLLESRTVQGKLTVNSPDDQYEREADAVAERIAKTASAHRLASPDGGGEPLRTRLQRQADEGDEKEEIQTEPVVNLVRQESRQENKRVQAQPASSEGAGSEPFPHIRLEVPALTPSLIDQQLDPDLVKKGLLQLPLGGMSSPSPSTSPAFTLPKEPPAGSEPLVPAGAGPEKPQEASSSDLLEGILAVPSVDLALSRLKTMAAERAARDWQRLGTGGKTVLISATALIGGGTLGGMLANRQSRAWAMKQLAGRILPVPGVKGLSVEINPSADNFLLGFHLDVGALLPKSLGFGPSSPSSLTQQPSFETGVSPLNRTPLEEEAQTKQDGAEISAQSVSGLQSRHRNAYVQRLLESMKVQAKLAVNPSDDKYEREAEAVAETVTRSASVQREAKGEEEESLQTRLQTKPQRLEVAQEPREADYRDFVETAIGRFEEGAKGNTDELLASGDSGRKSEKLRAMLSNLKTVYDQARKMVEEEFPNDEALGERLRTAYQSCLETMHRSVGIMPRVNMILVAAAPDFDVGFIETAAAYARSNFGGGTVIYKDDIGSAADLIDAIEQTHPEQMIGRVDIFAHAGFDTERIEGTRRITKAFHVIWFGDNKTGIAELQAEVDSRKYESAHVQSVSRFDEGSTIELHACRLGATPTGANLPRGTRPTRETRFETGEEFLTQFGETLGGEHGQAVTGYKQRWFPRAMRFYWNRNTPVQDTERDIYGPDSLPPTRSKKAFVRHFENTAISIFNQIETTTQEIKKYLTKDEQDNPGKLERKRKIEVMRNMYDENQAWLIGFQYPGAVAPEWKNTTKLPIKSPQYTLTGERDWQKRTLKVKVQKSK